MGINRRKFVFGAAAIGSAALLPSSALSQALQFEAPLHRAQFKEDLAPPPPFNDKFPIITARKIYKGEGRGDFTITADPTINPFNIVYDEFVLDSGLRYLIDHDRDTSNILPKDKDITVFIHGFNTDWDDAIRSAKAFLRNSASGNCCAHFNWPSTDRGQLNGSWRIVNMLQMAASLPPRILSEYVHSNSILTIVASRLVDFFEKLISEGKNGRQINIIAHSFGCSVTMTALYNLNRQFRGHQHFKNVVFFSPDISAKRFEFANNTVRNMVGRFTIYSSNTDAALYISQVLNERINELKTVRLGLLPDSFTVLPDWKTDFIRVKLPSYGLNHSFFNEYPVFADDVRNLIEEKAFGVEPVGNRPIAGELRRRKRYFYELDL